MTITTMKNMQEVEFSVESFFLGKWLLDPTHPYFPAHELHMPKLRSDTRWKALESRLASATPQKNPNTTAQRTRRKDVVYEIETPEKQTRGHKRELNDPRSTESQRKRKKRGDLLLSKTRGDKKLKNDGNKENEGGVSSILHSQRKASMRHSLHLKEITNESTNRTPALEKDDDEIGKYDETNLMIRLRQIVDRRDKENTSERKRHSESNKNEQGKRDKRKCRETNDEKYSKRQLVEIPNDSLQLKKSERRQVNKESSKDKGKRNRSEQRETYASKNEKEKSLKQTDEKLSNSIKVNNKTRKEEENDKVNKSKKVNNKINKEAEKKNDKANEEEEKKDKANNSKKVKKTNKEAEQKNDEPKSKKVNNKTSKNEEAKNVKATKTDKEPQEDEILYRHMRSKRSKRIWVFDTSDDETDETWMSPSQKKVKTKAKGKENKKNKDTKSNTKKTTKENTKQKEQKQVKSEEVLITAKRGTLKYLLQREDYVRAIAKEAEVDNDFFNSHEAFAKKKKALGNLLMPSSLDDSLTIRTPQGKGKNVGVSVITPRTSLLGRLSEEMPSTNVFTPSTRTPANEPQSVDRRGDLQIMYHQLQWQKQRPRGIRKALQDSMSSKTSLNKTCKRSLLELPTFPEGADVNECDSSFDDYFNNSGAL